MAMFADQMKNAALVESEGWGLSAPLEEMTQESFEGAVNEMLTNPK